MRLLLLSVLLTRGEAIDEVTWELHVGRNCFWDGHGAEEVDSPAGTAVPGVHKLTGCQKSCLVKPACEGFLFTKDKKCYRKKDIQPQLCVKDPNTDLYILVPSPSADASAPSKVQKGPQQPERDAGPLETGVDRINNRFLHYTKARAADLESAGVLVHQFDNMEPSVQEAWMPCAPSDWCAKYSDRISGTLVNAKSPRDPSGEVPLFSFDLAGIVLDPHVNHIFCAYNSDGGTMTRTCAPPGPHGDCLPGCGLYGTNHAPDWCGPNGGYCAYSPGDLEAMLESQRAKAGSPAAGDQKAKYYNEVMVDAAAFKKGLPSAVEAFFFTSSPGCRTAQKCEAYVREAHAAFVQRYGIPVPLLRLDLHNFERPFEHVL